MRKSCTSSLFGFGSWRIKKESKRSHVGLLDDFNAWFNAAEFAAYHDIDGVKVLCLLVSDRRGKTLNVILGDEHNSEGVIKARAVLFIRAQEIEGVKAGQSMSIDGRLYLVTDCRLLQNQVWRIELEANES